MLLPDTAVVIDDLYNEIDDLEDELEYVGDTLEGGAGEAGGANLPTMADVEAQQGSK